MGYYIQPEDTETKAVERSCTLCHLTIYPGDKIYFVDVDKNGRDRAHFLCIWEEEEKIAKAKRARLPQE